MFRAFPLMALALVACGGDGGGDGTDDCGIELKSVFPEDGATGVSTEGITVIVELTPDDAMGLVDIVGPNGEAVWGNIDLSPVEVELYFDDLAPNTEYSIEIAMAPGEGELVCNNATTTFTTGAASSR